MPSWDMGYKSEILYTYIYFEATNPLWNKFIMAHSGLAFPDLSKGGYACELGFGQGLSVNVHALTLSGMATTLIQPKLALPSALLASPTSKTSTSTTTLLSNLPSVLTCLSLIMSTYTAFGRGSPAKTSSTSWISSRSTSKSVV